MRPHPHLLEISAWPWLERSVARRGPAGHAGGRAAPCWDRIANDGFDYLFLMGVWRRSAIGRRNRADRAAGLVADYDRVLPGWTPRDVAGSPYCIQAYEPDDRMGGWPGSRSRDFDFTSAGYRLMPRLRSKPHRIRSRLDNASSHGALRARHPRRTTARAGRLPADCESRAHCLRRLRTRSVLSALDRRCTAELLQSRTLAMPVRATLHTVASHCDGVRCDMAMLVFNDVFDRTWRRMLRDAGRDAIDGILARPRRG